MKVAMRMAVAVVVLAAAAAWGQPAEPFVLEQETHYQISFGDQFYGAVTTSGEEYFAVWVDLRVGGANPAGYDLYAQRIRPDGSVVHPGSLELTGARGVTGIPGAAWNGANYLVAWPVNDQLRALRINEDGETLDPGGFLVDARTGQGFWPALGSDGHDFLIVTRTSSSILAFRVSGAGQVLDPGGIVITSGATQVGFPKVAWGDGVYLVTWTSGPGQAARAARVTSSGQVLDPGGIVISGGSTDVDAHVDFDGTNFYVVWQRLTGGIWDLWGAHVSPQEQVVTAPRQLLAGASFGAISSGQVAFNGVEHLITITTDEPLYSNTDLYALRVDIWGNPLGAPIPVNTHEGRSAVGYGIAAVPGQWFILSEVNQLWGPYYVYDVEGARVDQWGTVLDWPQPIAVSTSASWQMQSATSFDGANFLCIFEDNRNPPPDYATDLYAVRVSPEGVRLDETAIPVARSQRSMQHPDSVFGGGQHAVVWEHDAGGGINQVRMARILPDGTVLDQPSGLVVFSNEPTAETLRPKIAWNGQKYCVAWIDTYLQAGQLPLQFSLVRTDGSIEVSAANIPFSNFASLNGFELVSNGDEFLLVWIDLNSVKATRISAAGAVLGTQNLASTGNWITEFPQVGWNGQSYLAVWSQYSSNGPSIYARRISAAGAPLGTTTLVSGPHTNAAPTAIHALGTEFMVMGLRRNGNNYDLFAGKFDAAGAMIQPPQVLRSGPLAEVYAGPSAAMRSDGLLLITQSLWTSNPYNSPRAAGELFHFGNPCYPNCDGSTAPPILNVADFGCFLQKFAAGDGYANCDGSTTPPVLNVADFGCFLTAFAAGCR